jgi:predicted histidine transporter YuiF (NhaC family)
MTMRILDTIVRLTLIVLLAIHIVIRYKSPRYVSQEASCNKQEDKRMKKKSLKLFVHSVMVVLICIIVINQVQMSKKLYNRPVHIMITDTSCDFKKVEALRWIEEEKMKMVAYMKDKKLRLRHGEYQFKFLTTFEEALKIFKFEEAGSKEKSYEGLR